MAYTGDKKRAYQLAHVQKRRNDWIADNGPCKYCGSSDQLEVDHIISRRVGGGLPPAQIWSRRAEVRKTELEKCQVLCAPCHLIKSNNERRTTEHGRTMYRNGCRCDVCREAQKLAMRRLRAKV